MTFQKASNPFLARTTWTKMYGPPRDCKEKTEGEKTSLRKYIRQ